MERKLNSNRFDLLNIAADTKKYCKGEFSPEYLQLHYDIEADEAWITFHSSIGHNESTEYHNKNIINCGFITYPQEAEDIKYFIESALAIKEEIDALETEAKSLGY